MHATENRYTLAWAVATKVPIIAADDVEDDLVFTAQRALDKDWRRRSALRIEEFLADANSLEAKALKMFGLSNEPETIGESDAIARRVRRISEVSKAVQLGVERYLMSKHVIANHQTKPAGSDAAKLITWKWQTGIASTGAPPEMVELSLRLGLYPKGDGFGFVSSATLTTGAAEKRSEEIDLPELEDSPETELALIAQVQSAFGKLATKMIQHKVGGSE
jgi:hypothetical protein